MKKLLIFMVLITLVSCSIDNFSKKRTEELEECPESIDYPKPYKIYGVNPYMSFEIVLGEDGHEYLQKVIAGNDYILIHFPSCKKCTKNSTDYEIN